MQSDRVSNLVNKFVWLIRSELARDCCGEKDKSGVCAAPACRLGDCMKHFDKVFEKILYNNS